MKKIIIFSPDVISENMAGPGIRYWNFAVQLSHVCDVLLVSKNKDHPSCDKFRCIYSGNLNVKSEVYNSDVVILQGITLSEMPFLKKAGIPLVIDLYDPFILENLEMDIDNVSFMYSLEILKEQLFYGDYFICASDKQRDFWIGMLAGTNRINPVSYSIDHKLNNLISVVPFGLPEEKPTKTKRVIKGIIPGIEVSDKVVIWWGGLWDWLDPVSLVEAMNIVSKKNPAIKCIIVGLKHPDPSFIPHKVVDRVLKKSMELGLVNKSIFFIDWIKYEERIDYLLESDIGVSLHYDTLETKYSFRTRIMDYLWCSLPMIVTKGDILADIVEKKDLGVAIKPLDVQALADSILSMATRSMKELDLNHIQKDYYWSNVTKDLKEFCQNPKIAPDKDFIKEYQSKVKYTKRLNVYLMKGFRLIRKGNYKQLYLKMVGKIIRK